MKDGACSTWTPKPELELLGMEKRGADFNSLGSLLRQRSPEMKKAPFEGSEFTFMKDGLGELGIHLSGPRGDDI